MANNGAEGQLGATDAGPKPGDYPLGSAQSRAAARAKLYKQLAGRKTEGFTLIRGKHNPHGITRFLIVSPGESIAEVERLKAQAASEYGCEEP